MKLKLNDNQKVGLNAISYTKLEYIESTGTQYIDTGFNLTYDSKIDIKFNIISHKGSNTWYGIVGTRNSTTNVVTTSMCLRGYNTTTGAKVIMYGSYGSGFNMFNLNTDYNVVFDKTNININNTVYSYGSTPTRPTTENQCNAYIFKTNPYGEANVCSNLKLYHCKIYDNGVLVRDFIPCKDTDDVVCLYDAVSASFFYNSGTGNFIAGPELPYDVSNRFKLKCTDLFIKDCPNVNNIRLFNTILNTSGNTLSRIRINANNAVLTLSQAQQLLTMNGFNDNMQEQTKPRIVGSITINEYITQEFFTQLQNTLDGCTITAPNIINWNDLAVQTIDNTKPNYNPAVAIILANNNIGTTLPNPLISGNGKYILPKTTAATITISNQFSQITTVTDTNHIVNDNGSTYDFNSFDELQYFKLNINGNDYTGFYNCSKLTHMVIPTDAVFSRNSTRYRSHFSGCTQLVTIGNIEYITSLGNHMFDNCGKLELENINSTITFIPYAAFNKCYKITLKSLNNITTFENANSASGCFESCTLLKTYIRVIPSSVTAIGARCFRAVQFPYLHLCPNTPPTLYTNANYSGNEFTESYKLYVGDGSSQENDNTILNAYLANSLWSTRYASRLATWWSYCQSHSPNISIVDGMIKIDYLYQINCSSIYYTLDGTDPDENSTLYSEPFNIPASGTTIKAIEIGDTWRTMITIYTTV